MQHWCLGNEMDGPWQIGHMSATEYGLKAADAARQTRYVDPSLKLIACGSSGPLMPTYLEWDREALEQCYDYVDGLSLHRYFDIASRLVRNRLYWEGPQMDRPNERPYALHRNGYAGMQRYASFLWSGDVYSTRETL